jgi:cytochrome c-type biogenesis protein CcsB
MICERALRLSRVSGLVLVALAVIGLLASPSFAQTAPEGNAHPKTQNVSDTTTTGDPFGVPERDEAVATNQQKWDFSKAVDLNPLRDLAVFHNGRVKILDTLGRETVSKIAGRKNYEDFLHTNVDTGITAYTPHSTTEVKKEFIKKVSYDPLFTLLDLIIDPSYYADKPLIVVGYLPARREMLEAAFPKDGATVERWMRLTRVTPQMVSDHAATVFEKHEDKAPYREAQSRLIDSWSMWSMSKSNMMLIAPETTEKPWLHLTSLPADHAARKAANELGAAWRARDATRVNSAIRTLAAEIPKVNAPIYPNTKRAVEMSYNRVNAFEWGYWAYFLALVSLLLAFGTGRKWLVGTGVVLLSGAVLLHTFGFVTRCYIADRFAIQNQFESMTGLSLFAAIAGLVIMLIRRQPLFGAATAAVGFMILLGATLDRIPGRNIEKEAAILNTSVLLKYHVTTVLVSDGLISLGFIVSLFYLGTHYLGRARATAATGQVAMAGAPGGMVTGALNQDDDDQPASPVAGREKTLKDLDTAQMTVLQLAFWTLGVGILLGAWWADHSWGRWWAFDPKETWALITWIVYLIVIHVRLTTGKNRALITAWLSVIGFFVMLWTYFGVNLILPGLHAYA